MRGATTSKGFAVKTRRFNSFSKGYSIIAGSSITSINHQPIGLSHNKAKSLEHHGTAWICTRITIHHIRIVPGTSIEDSTLKSGPVGTIVNMDIDLYIRCRWDKKEVLW